MSKRNKFLAIALLLFSLVTYLVAWSPFFEVSAIDVIGAPREITMQEVVAQADISIGDKLARVEPRSVKNRLADLNWIASSEVTRHWFTGKVEISITPRIPVGIYDGRVLDRNGVTFDYPGTVPQGLPVVTSATAELGLEAISLFKKLPQTIRQSLVSISAVGSSSISSIQLIRGQLVVVQWGSLEQLSLKVKVYQALIALEENKKLKRIDLSAPHAPIVK